jgi:hypothetical protein
LDEVDDTSILKTGHPVRYRQSSPWLLCSWTSRTPQRAIAQRFSALAHRVGGQGVELMSASGELRKNKDGRPRPAPTRLPSRPGEFHPEPLTEPDLTLSRHPARATARRLPPSIETSGSSRRRLTRANGDSPLPSLHEHYARFIATTKQSAPGRRIGTFGLAVGAACAFSLGIAGQVLTFRTRAWSSFAPPTRRMPLGQSQDIPRADPGGWDSLRF